MNLPKIKRINNLLTPYELNVYNSIYKVNTKRSVFTIPSSVSILYSGKRVKVLLYKGKVLKLILFDKIQSEPFFTKMFLDVDILISKNIGALISSPLYDYTLKHYVESNALLYNNDIQNCIKDIGKFMIHMHSLSCYHNDIKPENIMYYRGKWILIDFGLTCNWEMINGDDFSMFFFSGTKPYMPKAKVLYSDREKCFFIKDWYAFCKTCILCFPYYLSEFMTYARMFVKCVDASNKDSFNLINTLYLLI